MYVYNPKQPSVPAFTARIVKPVEDYMAIFIDDSIARGFEREDLAGTFSKSYFQANPDRRTWPSDDVYDELARRTDLLDKDGKPLKPSWKGDLLLQILPEDGTLDRRRDAVHPDPPDHQPHRIPWVVPRPRGWSQSATSTSCRSWCRFAIANAAEGTTRPRQCSMLSPRTPWVASWQKSESDVPRSKERNQSWPVIVFDPIHIEPMVAG